MDFLGIGPLELLLILFVLLVAVGPTKLPEIAGQIGRGIRKFRTATTALTREIQDELDGIKKEASAVTGSATEVTTAVREAASEVADAKKDVLTNANPATDLEQIAGEIREVGKEFSTIQDPTSSDKSSMDKHD